jgi:polyphenol oxidase
MILGTSTLYSEFSEIKFFISSKTGGVSPAPYFLNMSFHVNDSDENVLRNRQIFYDAVKISKENIAFQSQIHSATVKIADTPGIYSDCDALITDKKNIFLTVSIADCVPIFLYDRVNHVVAAIHSGWQGSSKKIVLKTIDQMSIKYGTNSENIFAHIGYSAGACCYEVGSDVAEIFGEGFIIPKSADKFHLDLKKFNKNLLFSAGVPDKQIEVSKFCTICNPNFLHSYRRDGKKSGRMMGIIGMTD